jgi:hypothetical protein
LEDIWIDVLSLGFCICVLLLSYNALAFSGPTVFGIWGFVVVWVFG